MQDFLPVVAFIAAYVGARLLGSAQAMYIATAVLMLVSVLQIIYFKWRQKPIEKRHWLTLAVILLLGSITLIFHNDLFIKLKPTILNILIAIVFLGSQFFGQKNLTKAMLHSVFDMPELLWRKLNFVWVGFFLFEAGLNSFVALRFSNDVYVAFKFWGLLLLTMLFMTAQIFVLKDYLRRENNDDHA